jgi:hypothetical protein
MAQSASERAGAGAGAGVGETVESTSPRYRAGP